ncbi:MAG: chorismate mutase [Alphaproteobacteria bacterium]|nr:chorismate mutase [Alphaproteobacteria bacterium]
MAKDLPLDNLRLEIDRIDDEIHDLLMRRTDIVSEIGALKRRSGVMPLALRPGREAAILRRLLARHEGPFPRQVLVRIWRELLSAQVALQSDFSIAVFAPDGLDIYRELARDQFGAGTPLHKYSAVSQIISDIWNGNISIGILPMPVGERSDPWWRALVVDGGESPRVVAKLPFYERLGEGDLPSALAVAMIEPEATDDDVSLVGIERVADMSRDRVLEDLADSGLDAHWMAAWQDPEEEGHAMYLVSVEGFLSRDEPRLDAYCKRAGAAVARAVVLGAFARPLVAKS